MASRRAPILLRILPSLFLLVFVFVFAQSARASSPSIWRPQQHDHHQQSSWLTVRSLVKSLLLRIRNLRLSKGDNPGTYRIDHILSSFNNGFSFWKKAGSLGWDYLVNYSWRNLDYDQIHGIFQGINGIQSFIEELLQLSSPTDRLQWISLNYGRILKLSKEILHRLLILLDQPGALRNFVLALQTEIVSGDLMQDALELGASDLHSLFQVAKDILKRYHGRSYSDYSSEL